jgi:hypothetical protein
VVRDPPRKSEQACRVQSSWGRRAQPRRPSKSGAACIERRQRNGRGQRYCLRIHGTQRQRVRRVLGEAAPSPGARRRSVCQIGRARRRSISSQNNGLHGRSLTSYRKTDKRRVLEKEWMVWIGGTRLDCKFKGRSQYLGDLVSYLSGNIVCTIGRDDGAWNKLFQLGRTGHNSWLRYLFYSSRWINVLDISFAHAWTKRSLCRMQYNVSESILGIFREICDLCTTSMLILKLHLTQPSFLQ